MPPAAPNLRPASRWLNATRAAWLLTAALLTLAAAEATAGRSAPVRVVGFVLACAVWAVELVALIVPSTASLSAARTAGPLALPAAGAAALNGASAMGAAALAVGAVAVVLLLSADVGHAFVQASAYGDEHRNLLRPPAATLQVAVLAWLVWAGCITTGPLLLAARQWLIGVLLSVAAVAGTVILVPRFHALCLRWLVTLPTGVVVHDPLLLAETLMAPRSTLRSLHLALAGTGAADLTGPAAGHAVEVVVEPMTTITLRDGRGATRAIHAAAFLVAPTRPGAALRAAAARRLPVG